MEAKRAKLSDDSSPWFELLPELRYMIIEVMDTPTKGRFMQTSEQCYEEVMLSKNFVKGIYFFESDDYISIELKFHDEKYNTEFIYNDEDSYPPNSIQMICKNKYKRWDIEKFDVQERSIQHFNRIYDNSRHLERLKIRSLGNFFPFDDMNVDHLNLLNTLEIIEYYDFEKTDFIEYDQVVSAEKLTTISRSIVLHCSLNLEQLLQLKARKIRLLEMNMTTKFLNLFLKFVSHGELHRNVKKVKLDSRKKKDIGNFEEILDGLNFVDRYEEDGKMWLEIKIKPHRYARVRITNCSFLLTVRAEQKRENYVEHNSSDSYAGSVYYLDSDGRHSDFEI